MGFFSKRKNPQTGEVELSSNVTIDTKMIDLTKKAAISLEKVGLGNQRAAVSLILDYSGSMGRFYTNGSVQRLAEQTIGLATNLDDDGIVPVRMFHHGTTEPFDVSVTNYQGVIAQEMAKRGMGGTCYAPVMRQAVDFYMKSGASDPGLMIFQSDGNPEDRDATETLLREYSSLPIFWAFVGFGGAISFLESLDTLRGRLVDNASFFHATNPLATSDADLYDGITHEFASWITNARAERILR